MYLQANNYGVCLADETNDDRTLLHCLVGILDLEDSSLWRAEKLLA